MILISTQVCIANNVVNNCSIIIDGVCYPSTIPDNNLLANILYFGLFGVCIFLVLATVVYEIYEKITKPKMWG